MVYLQLEKTDFEVLELMIKNIETKYSIKQLADLLKKTYVKVHKSVQRLSDKNIIKKEILGKSHYCIIDYKNNTEIVSFINSLRAKSFLEKNKSINIFIKNLKENIPFPDYILVLFGSYAKGNETKNSDLDIAIITSKENNEQAETIMNTTISISNLKIHPLEFNYQEFISMLKSRKLNVGNEIFKSNIIINGCEQFYDCKRLADEE